MSFKERTTNFFKGLDLKFISKLSSNFKCASVADRNHFGNTFNFAPAPI